MEVTTFLHAPLSLRITGDCLVGLASNSMATPVTWEWAVAGDLESVALPWGRGEAEGHGRGTDTQFLR